MNENQIWKKYMRELRFDELNRYEWKQIEICTIDTLFDGKEYLKIPKCAIELVFGSSFNEKLDTLEIPSSINRIHFNSVYTHDLSKIKISDDCIFNFSRINDKILNNLPSNLKYLGVVELTQPLTNLPSSLSWLMVKRGNEHLKNSKIPHQYL